MISEDTARAVIKLEMERQGVNPHSLKKGKRLDVPASTVYQLFNNSRSSTKAAKPVRLSVEIVAKILGALGKTYAWLERECEKLDKAVLLANGRPAKPAKKR